MDDVKRKWDSTLPVAHTLKIHCVKPAGLHSIYVGKISDPSSLHEVNIIDSSKQQKTAYSVGDWVLVTYDGNLFPVESTSVVCYNESWHYKVNVG